MALKKANLKSAHNLQLQKEKTAAQEEKMRMLVCQQDQSVYHLNRLIYEREKERDALAVEAAEMDATYIDTKDQIRVKLVDLEQLREREREEGDKLERLTTSHEEINVKIKEGILHEAVLKMQVNPHLRVSFESSNCSLSTRKRIL
jgi:hypothetical protein